jgi:hypothetical protein
VWEADSIDELRSIVLDEFDRDFFVQLVRRAQESHLSPSKWFELKVLDGVYEMLECQVIAGDQELIIWSPGLERLLQVEILDIQGSPSFPSHPIGIQITDKGRAYYRYLESAEYREAMRTFKYDVAISCASTERDG